MSAGVQSPVEQDAFPRLLEAFSRQRAEPASERTEHGRFDESAVCRVPTWKSWRAVRSHGVLGNTSFCALEARMLVFFPVPCSKCLSENCRPLRGRPKLQVGGARLVHGPRGGRGGGPAAGGA